jgi:membrane protein
LFALYFGAKGLLKVLRVSYGMIWNVRPSKLKKTTVPILAVIGLTTLALLAAALVGSLRHEGLLLAIVGFVFTTGIPFGIALLAAWYLPRRARTWQELAPGAVLVALGIQLLHMVTVLWIAHVLESKTDTYGAIGAALAILLWAYLLGRLITAAAVIDATLWLRHREVDPGQDGVHSTPEGNQ